ncbi:MAG: hypothetical protein J1E81_02495 [Eubacterium sp.]|nr:hypothetical protein [Eubacterium sp.]
MENYVGKKFVNRYDVEEIIAVGKKSVIYRAYDITEKRTVALKYLIITL